MDFGLRNADLEATIRTPQSAIQNKREPARLPLDPHLPEVQLFTDGACSGNPGPGGWAFILRHPATGKEMEQSGGEALSTNNKMELTAAVEGLGALKRRSHVELLTDSVYVGKGMYRVAAQVEGQRLEAQRAEQTCADRERSAVAKAGCAVG